MKKMTKKNLMRALALIMAVVMVATSGAFSSGGWLRATGIIEDTEGVDAPVEEIAEVLEEAEPEEVAEESEEEVQGGTEEVEIEIPEEPVEEIPTEEVPAEEVPAEEVPAEEPQTSEEAPATEVEAPVAEEIPEVETKVCAEKCILASGHDGDCEFAVAMPAVEFTASAGGVNVHVKAPEGAFPEGTTMSVVALSSSQAVALANEASAEDAEVRDAKALDITFHDKDGNEIQPEVAISVNFSNVGLSGSDIEEINVYHVEDNGNTDLVTGNATKDSASFSTSSFSVYIISGETTSKYITYQFYVDGTIYDSQIVKTGDTLYQPETPTLGADDEFLGWYDGDTLFTSFGVQGEISADATVTLNAKFETVYYVFFMDNTGRVYTTKEGKSGNTISANITFPVAANEAVTGWYLDAGLTQKVDSVTIENSNITLYPKVETGNWITYFGHGGTHTESVFYAPGAATVAPANPTRSGYEFKHWATEENGTTAFTFGGTLTADVALHAVWEADTRTEYTVIHWQENANDNNYSFKEAETKTGTTGTQTNATAKSYEGFTAQTITQETIEGTGTIVNVYYTRNVYTVKFYQYSQGSNGTLICGKDSHRHDWACDVFGCNKEEHSHTSECYSGRVERGWNEITSLTITAKYGAYIGDKWPSKVSSSWNTLWAVSQNGNTYQANIDTMPLNGTSFYYVSQSGDKYQAYYYLEVLDGTAGSVEVNGVKYSLDHTDTVYSSQSLSVTDEDRYPITGFTCNTSDSTKNKSSYNNAKFYYTRNDYSIVFMNGGAKDSTITKQYGASLADVSYIPERPSTVPADYIFEGWYDNEFCEGEPYVFAGTMPAQNITVYAKWAAPIADVTVHLTMEGNGGVQTFEFSYGDKITDEDLPEITVPEGYTWVGWATKDANGNFVPYDLNSEIYGDLTLYPVYINSSSFSISYNANGGSGTVADSNKYAEGSHAEVKFATVLTAPANKVFIGWNTKADGSGTMYQPKDKILFSAADLVLYAQWGDKNDYTWVRYHSNLPNGTGTLSEADSVENNGIYTVATYENKFGNEPDEYYFAGWTTAADGSGNLYTEGQQVRADRINAETSNVLYAKWEAKTELTITANSAEYTYDGSEKSVEGFITTEVTVNGKTYVVSGLTATASEKNTGTYDTVISGTAVITLNGTDVTANCKLTAVPGTLTINKKDVTLTSASDTKEYDGSALENHTVTAEGFVDGEGANYNVTGSQTLVGNSKNTFTYVLTSDTKAENYNITVVEGTLTVTESTAEITVTTTGGTYTYNGKAHGATVKVTGLPKGYTVQTAVSGDILTDVGTITADCDTLVILNTEGTDVTDELNVTYVNGTITVNPAPLTVVTESASKDYDGTELTASGKINGLVNGETVVFAVTGSQTAVGTSSNSYSLAWTGTAKESNYTVSEDLGTLEVIESTAEITVTTTGGEFVYDGKAHNATVSVSALPTGYTLVTAVSNDTLTNVGNIEANCDTLLIENAAGEDVTDKLNIKYEDGNIIVTPATLTIVTETASKVYDGTKLTASGNITGFVNNETATFVVTGSQTAVGTSKNTYTLTFDGTAKESNYTVSESVGTLTVTENANEIVVTTTGGEFTYDGQAHGATVSVSELPAGYTLVTATSSATATDVTTTPVTATCDTLVIVNTAGEDVTSRLKITKIDGTIKINPAALVVTTDSASKVYDGTALTASGEITGFVNNETATFETTGSQTAVGTSSNTYKLTFNGTAKESNYTVSDTLGTLEVTENQTLITVTTTGGTFVYDGKAHGATVSVSTLPTGYTLVTATSNDTVTNVAEGKVTANCDTLVIKNVAGVDVTDKLNISYVDGTLEITPAPVTVMTPDANKIYDGSALTASGQIKGLMSGETVSFATTGTQTDAGSSKNTYELTWDRTAVASNYTVSETVGTLTVTKRNITLTSADDSKTYDGTALTNDTVTVSGDGFIEGEGASFHVTGTQTLVGSSANTFTYSLTGNANEKNYAINKVEGTLTVTDDIDPEKPEEIEKVVKKTHENKEYGLGDTINFTITVKNIYDVVKDITISEQPGVTLGNVTYDGNTYTPDEATGAVIVEDVAAGEEVSVSATYVVAEADILAGTFTNNVNVTFENGGSYTDPDEVPDIEDKDAKLTITKVTTSTPATGNDYALGETITYKITATNTGNVTLTGIVVRDDLTNQSWPIESLAPGASADFNTSYVVTEADVVEGTVINVATATGEDPDGEDPKVTPGTEEEDVEDPNPSLAVDKETTSTPADGTAYVLGETITYKITVTNNGNLTITNIEVEDPLTGGSWDIASLAPGASEDFTTSYVVTANDIASKDGKITNVATAEGENPTEQPTEPGEDKEEEPIVNPNPGITVKKEATLVDGTAIPSGYEAEVGDVITYEITVTNTGNVVVSDITVKDELVGLEETIASLAPAAAETYTVTYTVVEADLINGKVVNVATAEGTDPDDKDVEDDAEEEISTEDVDSALTITKETTSTAATDGKYALGETITYKITAANTGNITLKNVVVTDELTGDEWTIATLAPGASKDFTAEYVVTEADILAGKVVNEATATAEDEDPDDDPTIIPGKEEDPTDDENPELTIAKETTSKAATDDKYALGETITYKITATNTGNLTLTNVVVTDELTGDEWTIASLAPGASEDFTAEYVVTEADIEAGKVLNVATGTADGPGEEPTIIPGKEEDPTDDKDPKAEVDKKAIEVIDPETNAPKTLWIVGDTIQYEIIVKNTGNLTLTDLTVDDDMNAEGDAKFTNIADLIASGIEIEEVDQDTVILKSLAPGAEVRFLCEYTILREDAGKTISNNVEVDNPSIDPGKDEEETPVEELYTLTIHYVDANGNPLAPDYIEELVRGEIVSVDSPVITGYTTNVLVVTTAPDGMPGNDLEIWVVYTAVETPGPGPTPEPEPEPTPDPEPTPTPDPTPDPTPTPGPAPTPVAPPAEISESGTYAITQDEEGNYILTPIEEIEIPLADIDLDEHKCCILHFLIMLAAFIILAVHMRNQKKRQARVFELREEIELEKAKKDLGEGRAVPEAEVKANE